MSHRSKFVHPPSKLFEALFGFGAKRRVYIDDFILVVVLAEKNEFFIDLFELGDIFKQDTTLLRNSEDRPEVAIQIDRFEDLDAVADPKLFGSDLAHLFKELPSFLKVLYDCLHIHHYCLRSFAILP